MDKLLERGCHTKWIVLAFHKYTLLILPYTQCYITNLFYYLALSRCPPKECPKNMSYNNASHTHSLSLTPSRLYHILTLRRSGGKCPSKSKESVLVMLVECVGSWLTNSVGHVTNSVGHDDQNHCWWTWPRMLVNSPHSSLSFLETLFLQKQNLLKSKEEGNKWKIQVYVKI